MSSSVAAGVLCSIAGPYSSFLTERDLDRFRSTYSSNRALAPGRNIPQVKNADLEERDWVPSTIGQRHHNSSNFNLRPTLVPSSSRIGDGKIQPFHNSAELDKRFAGNYSPYGCSSRSDEEYVGNMKDEKSKICRSIINMRASTIATKEVRTPDLGVIAISNSTEKYDRGVMGSREDRGCTTISRARSDIDFDASTDADQQDGFLSSSGILRAQHIDGLPSSFLESEKETKLNNSGWGKNISLNTPDVMVEDNALIDIDISIDNNIGVDRAGTLKKDSSTSEEVREKNRDDHRNRLQDRIKDCISERMEEQIRIVSGRAGDTRVGKEGGALSDNLHKRRVLEDDGKNENMTKDENNNKDEYLNVSDDVTATFR